VAENLRSTLTGKTLEWSVVKCCLQRGILLPLLSFLVVDNVTEGLDVNGCYTLDMCYCHQRKIPKECPTASSGGFEYGTTVLWYNADINRSRKVQHLDQCFMEPGQVENNLLARHNFFQSVRPLNA